MSMHVICSLTCHSHNKWLIQILDYKAWNLVIKNKTAVELWNFYTMETLVYLICIVVASFAVLAQPAVAQEANANLPLTYPGQILQGDYIQNCPSEEQQERARNEVDNATLSLLRESVVPLLQQTFSCGGSTGWRRVAYLNMSDPSQHCPPVWQEITAPHRVCGRRSTSSGDCQGVTYSTSNTQYDQVCGRIIGYQLGQTDSFRGSGQSINTYYVDGISVTRGSPRQHIWTFANGVDEHTTWPCCTCPCVTGSNGGNSTPSFVGQDYFCESGLTQWNGTSGILWPDGDPLWDGQGCGPTSSCCTFNSPPWFNVQLPSPTINNIEVRICGEHSTRTEDTPIQLMELYVKWTGRDQHCEQTGIDVVCS